MKIMVVVEYSDSAVTKNMTDIVMFGCLLKFG